MSIPRSGEPATIADVERVSGKAEIVDGRLVMMSASNGVQGMATLNVATSLKLHQRAVGGGSAYGDNVIFAASETRTFSPHAAWHPDPVRWGVIGSAPLFAVEIRGEDGHGPAAEGQMAWKRADYFAAGTLVVWGCRRDARKRDPRLPCNGSRDTRRLSSWGDRGCGAGGSGLAVSGGRVVGLIMSQPPGCRLRRLW